MNYISLDIRVGSSGLRKITALRLMFHEKVTRILFPSEEAIKRIGLMNSSPIDHYNYVHTPGTMATIIQKAFVFEDGSNDPVDLCIVDFTSNDFYSVRDPLLLSLADGIAEACRTGSCSTFAILMPQLPGTSSASRRQFKYIKYAVDESDFTVIMISDSEKTEVVSSVGYTLPDTLEGYANCLEELYGAPLTRLNRKTVRRLGHFVSKYPQENRSKCRRYSYYMYSNCEDELLSLLSDWWQDYGEGNSAILYDLRNNAPLRNVVRAFCAEHLLYTESIKEYIRNAKEGGEAVHLESCIVILDVIDTGTTFLQYVEELESLGISVANNVAVAINKRGGETRSTVNEYVIHGFLSKEGEGEESPCLQCKLELPHTSDSDENYHKIRAFDMQYMTHISGWGLEPEEEVPSEIEQQYQMIPKFSKMVDEFGDWIAFKIHQFFEKGHCPEDWFIIHPDEADSSAISDRLQVPLDYKLGVVKGSRPLVRGGHQACNAWTDVFAMHPDLLLMEELEMVTPASGLILDIFNGSGSTAASLEALLRHFDIVPFAHVCLVDFNPGREGESQIEVPIYSLYEWYNPRNPNDRH